MYVLFQPLPRKFKLLEANVKKFPESAWRTIVYSFLWGWAVYLCIVNEKQYFFYPVNHWIGELYVSVVLVHYTDF